MRSRGSVTGPLILIAVGVVFLVKTVSPHFHMGDLIGRFWPYLLIFWGAAALIEICFRFVRNAPIPRNGVPGGAWVIVVLIAIFGSATFEFDRPNNWHWLRQVGFAGGLETFGDAHQYPIEAISRPTGPTPRIVFDDFRGDIKITGTDTNEISVSGQKTIHSFDPADADKANGHSPVEVLSDGNTITIRCNQDNSGTQTAVRANLDISVPKGAAIQASDSRGSVDISALKGDIVLTGGSVEDVHIQDVQGDVRIDAHSTQAIHLTNVAGSVDLHGRGSDADLENIAGQVTIGGDYTGTISLRALAKPVHLESMRTQLDAQQVNGYIRLDRGSLDAKDLTGPIKLTAKNTDVTIANFTDTIDLNVDRGDIELRPEHPALSPIAVHARSGNIELAVPSMAKFALVANTDNGEIDNQYGETLKGDSAGRGARLEGSVGTAGPDVNLITKHGSITLRKASGEESGDNKNSDQ